MFKPKNSFQQRAMQVMAWFVFGFCTMFIVTGFFISTATPLAAEDSVDGAETTAEVIAEVPGDAQRGSIGSEVVAPVAEAGPAAPAADTVNSEEVAEDTAPITFRTVGGGTSSLVDKSVSFFGIFALLGVAVLLSNNRKKINWRLVAIGVGLQLTFAILIFYVPGGERVFAFATSVIQKLLEFTGIGSEFVFSSFVSGKWEPGLINFAFSVLPTIIFFSALMTVMYHLGIMQLIVRGFAWVMQKTMNISGAESMSAAANIFVGQTEAPLVVKPFVNEMTESELDDYIGRMMTK